MKGATHLRANAGAADDTTDQNRRGGSKGIGKVEGDGEGEGVAQ